MLLLLWSRNRVSIEEGLMSVTEIGSSSCISSSLRPSVKPFTACLVAE